VTPPLMMFISGNRQQAGRRPPTYRYSGWPVLRPRPDVAIETAEDRVRAEPTLFFVRPGRSCAVSNAVWSNAERPVSASAISPLTASTALPSPGRYNGPDPPSGSSTASFVARGRPEGPSARPSDPPPGRRQPRRWEFSRFPATVWPTIPGMLLISSYNCLHVRSISFTPAAPPMLR